MIRMFVIDFIHMIDFLVFKLVQYLDIHSKYIVFQIVHIVVRQGIQRKKSNFPKLLGGLLLYYIFLFKIYTLISIKYYSNSFAIDEQINNLIVQFIIKVNEQVY